MIDINELRVGAHIIVNGIRAKIVGISNPSGLENGLYQISAEAIPPLSGKKTVVICMAKSGEIEPIPITAELLQELGLAKSCGDVVAFIDTKSAKVMAEKNGENVIPTIEVWQDEYTRPYWIVAVMCSNGDIPLPHGRIAVRYLHELEAFVYMTTKTELIKED